MNRYQPIHDIAELCYRKKITDAVLCPGSRCAPLTIAFARHPHIQTRTFSDERSAAFIAMGIAQQQLRPTLLVCTSGSAAYNFAPAVAEAFFSQTPLIIFTADRPSEWIAQHDGQTIHQQNIFGQHVKKSFQLPQDYEHGDSVWAINRIVNEAINLSIQEPKGPVHINAPFREPLYPKDEVVTFSENVRVMEQVVGTPQLSEDEKTTLREEWSKYNRILVVAGQCDHNEGLTSQLSKLIDIHQVAVVGDIISNLHGIPKVIRHVDLFLGQASDAIKDKLRPDLIISFGKSAISKNLKLFLRKAKPLAHWHLHEGGIAADTFQSITKIINVAPQHFFEFINTTSPSNDSDIREKREYHALWETEEQRTQFAMQEFLLRETFSELELVHAVMRNLPANCNLHLANSMSVRYANFIGLLATQQNISVYANRGTSGIDGCTSTAVGHSLSSDVPNYLITGDIAFFYDRNAFWHNYPINNLRIILLNNHGGVIFGIIDGPGALPEADEFFITRQKLNAKKLCEEFGFDHVHLNHPQKVTDMLADFMQADQRTKILEIETDVALNKEVFNKFKQKIKNNYDV